MNRHAQTSCFSWRGQYLRVLALAAVSCALIYATGCTRDDAANAPKANVRVEDASWGPIEVAMTFTPGSVAIDRDMRMELRIVSPSEVDVVLPDLTDRLEGFAASGQFERDPILEDGKSTRVVHMRLTPLVAERYRIAPFAIRYTDRSVTPPLTGWFPTKPILLETDALPTVSDDATPAVDFAPVWVRPTARIIALYTGMAVLALGLLYLLWRLLRRVREEVALRRMSPRERALRELNILLAKDLIKRHKIKEFYLELTMIVRRYIERRHAIRAPEQTTEEFLEAVSHDTRFNAEVVRTLRTFLQAADMVKFAAYQPGDAAISEATDTARDYIAADDEATESEGT